MLALSRRVGTIRRWYNGEGGYGFEGGEAIFVHHTGIAARTTKAKSLTEGTRVAYEVARQGMGGKWAKNVCIAG